MVAPQVHPEVLYLPTLGNHLLFTPTGVAIVNPLKTPVERSKLRPTDIHPDVKLCNSGHYLLVHEGKVVAKVIPVPAGKEKLYFSKAKR